MQNVEAIISGLKAEIDLLKAEIDLLKAGNAKLKGKLGLTSKNSSIPSSKELYKLKKQEKVKSIGNRGGHPGHPGSTRAKMLADEVVDLPIADKCQCGGQVALAPNPYIHQKVDLPEIKPHVVTYHVQHGRCRKCGKGYTASLPKGVTRDTFGPKIKSAIAALTVFYKNSKREVAHILIT